MTENQLTWSQWNQQWLVAGFDALRARCESRSGNGGAELRRMPEDCVNAGETTGPTPALVTCAEMFSLTPFERELLLLVAGAELDQRLRQAIAALNGGSPMVNFSLALALLTQPHWDALSTDSPLRYWRLIDVEAVAAPATLMRAPLRIDERILHFITGVEVDDPALTGFARRIDVAQADSLEADPELADRIAGAFGSNEERGPIVVLHGEGPELAHVRTVALAAMRRLGNSALWMNASDLPSGCVEIAQLARLVDRECALTGALPVLAVESGSEVATASFAGAMRSPLLWLGAACTGLRALPHARPVIRFDVAAPAGDRTRAALIRRWNLAQRKAAHADLPPDVAAALQRAAAQFRLTSSAMDNVMQRLSALPPEAVADAVWNAAREAVRGGLDAVAQRVESNVRFADIVLPSAQLAVLHDIARQLRNRERVYREWGFAAKHPRSQGMTALFAGESGTGKTLAAEAIANEAELDLYRIDLATVVSKYIGETEKNLKTLFAAAEASGAVLLFDEADALFGKRSEVKDSHDRYANIEIAYLLQRMESYRGLAILTTNMKPALDRAFLRRIRFVVQFPFPDAVARERIWRREFPAATPLGDIDFAALATLNLSGGSIHSIVLNAAFRAADGPRPVSHSIVAEAARAEFAKLERTFIDVVPGGAA
jgi:AAA+ superfamily predicted ATPase